MYTHVHEDTISLVVSPTLIWVQYVCVCMCVLGEGEGGGGEDDDAHHYYKLVVMDILESERIFVQDLNVSVVRPASLTSNLYRSYF